MQRSWARLLAVPLMALVAVFGIFFHGSVKVAFAWELKAECQNNQIVGTIDIPSDAGSGLPYNVFAEWQDSGGGWHWVTDAGQNINHTGLQSYSLDVSKRSAEAVVLRVRYKDRLGHYGPEVSNLINPATCVPPTPTATPVTPTATSTRTATPTNTPVTPTKTPKPHTPTPTKTVVTATSTSTSVPPTATRTPAVEKPCKAVICLPNTGSGDGTGHSDSYYLFEVIVGSVIAVIALVLFGLTIAIVPRKD